MPVLAASSDAEILAFIVALIALAVALASAKYQHDSVVMQRAEHSTFMQQLNARADFTISLRVTGNPKNDLTVRTEQERIHVIVTIGLKNVGDTAARNATLNVVLPRRVTAVWSHESGSRRGDAERSAETDELLEAGGESLPAQYLARQLDHLGRKAHYVTWVLIDVGRLEVGVTEIPLRVNLTADELADDVEEISERFVVRITRSEPS